MTMNPDYRAQLAGAVFGSNHSANFPDTWSLGWFDEVSTEITGTGYARVPVANSNSVWTVSGDTIVNLIDIDGGTPGGSDWPDIYGLYLYDEFGVPVFAETLSAPITPVSGVPIVLAAGDFTVTVGA